MNNSDDFTDSRKEIKHERKEDGKSRADLWRGAIEQINRAEASFAPLKQAQEWMEEHAPEIYTGDAVGDMIRLLEFYMYGSKGMKTAIEQMEEEAANGRLISSEEATMRLLDDAINREVSFEQTARESSRLEAIMKGVERELDAFRGFGPTVIKDDHGHMTTTR